MNRRASGEEIALFMFLFIMVILLAGILAGVYSFFNKGYDFRLAESSQLRAALVSCFTREGPDVFFATFFNITLSCGISEEVLLDGVHYVRLRDAEVRSPQFVRGVTDYETQCDLSTGGARENAAYPRCVSGNITFKGATYSYLVGSNQHGRRSTA